MARPKTVPMEVTLRFVVDVRPNLANKQGVAAALARRLRGNIKEGIEDGVEIIQAPRPSTLKWPAEKAQFKADRAVANDEATS